jgi:Tfp pilus assembly protein PilO
MYNQFKQAQAPKPKSKKMSWSFNSLFVKQNMFLLIEKNMLYIMFLTLILVGYIYNSHFAEKQARYADKLREEIKELKSSYMTTNAQLSQVRAQSEISPTTDTLGLKRLDQPPFKLTIQHD